MKRWIWGVFLLLCTGGVGGLFWWGGEEGEEESDSMVQAPLDGQTSPNVVLFTLDTTRADHLGAYGYQDIKTPTIDALAQGGVLFRRAISPAPITLPSHSSIMTGLYPPSHGVRDNGTFVLPEEMMTLAEILHNDGYATGAFVGAAVLERRYGLTQGFDVYDDDFSQGRRRQLFMYAERQCEQVVSSALRWVEQHKNAPFFTWLHFYDPHAGYDPPEPWVTEYEGHLYDGEIAYTDHCIGTFIDALRHWGLWQETLIILTSDHGESLGEHGEKTHGLFIYDATVHVPLIFHAPTRLPAGRVVREVVRLVDILPTVLSVLRKPIPQALDGGSLVGLIRGHREEPRTAYSEALLPKYHYGWAELKGITTQAWKLIDAPKPELYALLQDPKELVNVHERESRRFRELKKTLTSLAKLGGGPEARLELDPQTAERLRGLGYVWMPEREEVRNGDSSPDPKDMIYTHEHVQQGRDFLRQDRFDEAIAEFQAVVAANPRSMSTYFDIASAYLEKGDPEPARQAMAQVLSLDSQNARAYTMMGIIEGRLGNFAAAFPLLQRAMDLNPRQVDAAIAAAGLWEQKGELEKAETVIRKALQLIPTHTNALSRLGSILLTKGDVKGAEEHLKAALKGDPFDGPTHRTLGVLYDQAGRLEEALREYQEALRSNNRLADVHHAIGIIYTKQGKFDQAEVQTKEALRIDPKYVDAFISLGIIYDRKGLKRKAMDANMQALRFDSKAYQAYGNLAVLYIQENRYDKAEEALLKALAIKVDYPEAYNNLAALYMERDELKKAITSAERAIHYKADYPEALTNLGILYDKQGKLETALTYHQRAVLVNPAYWEGRYNLALTLKHARRYAEAAEEFTKALQIRPQLAAAHKHLGDLYFEHLKDWGKARQHYEVYLRISPHLGKEQREVQARLLRIAQS